MPRAVYPEWGGYRDFASEPVIGGGFLLLLQSFLRTVTSLS